MKAAFVRLAYLAAMGVVLGVAAGAQERQQPAPPAPRCRISGRVTSGNVPLPGVSIVVHAGGVLRGATSTGIDGSYTIFFAPNAAYQVSADLAGFTGAARDLALAAPPCDDTVDFELALAPRAASRTTDRAVKQDAEAAPAPPAPAAEAGSPRQGRGAAGPGAAGGRGRQAGTAPRFQPLNVQPDASGAAALDVPAAQESEDVGRLLPAGFSVETAQADAIAISGSSAATNLDRGSMNDRLQLVSLGQLDPASGEFAAGFGPQPGGFFQLPAGLLQA